MLIVHWRIELSALVTRKGLGGLRQLSLAFDEVMHAVRWNTLDDDCGNSRSTDLHLSHRNIGGRGIHTFHSRLALLAQFGEARKNSVSAQW